MHIKFEHIFESQKCDPLKMRMRSLVMSPCVLIWLSENATNFNPDTCNALLLLACIHYLHNA